MSDAYSVGTQKDAAATAGGDGTVIALLKLLTNQLAAGGVGNQVEGQVAEGGSSTGINPLLAAGLNAGTVRSLAVSGGGILSVGVAGGTAAADGAAINVFVGPMNHSGGARSGMGVLPFGHNGTTADILRVATTFKVVSLTAATTETTIWTPTTGKKFRLMGFILTVGAASTLTFKDNTAGTTIAVARGTTDVPIITPGTWGNGLLSAAANNVLTVTRGTSATLDGVVFGTEE